MSISFIRRALPLIAGLAFACAFLAAPAPAQAAHTSLQCAAKSASVLQGGSVTIDVTDCATSIGFAGIGTVDGPALPAHGAANLRISGSNWFVDYSHNGDSATSDVFEFSDGTVAGRTVRVTISITPAAGALVVSPGSLPTLVAGTPFSQTLSTTGGSAPYAYSLDSGALPAGVSLSSGGVVSGTPTQRGAYTFGVRASDAASATAVKGYTGSVQNPSLSLAPNTGTAAQGMPFTQTLNTVGGVAPYIYALETGSLPAGLTLSSAGVISGTTSAALGSYPVTLRVTDASTGPGTYFELEPFTLTVTTPPSVSISVSPASVSEDGASGLTYAVTRSAASSNPLTVILTASGTATSGADYTGGAASVTIAAGATTATLTLDPTADATVEADETVTLTVAPGSGYTVGAPASATGTILNDDVPSASVAVVPSSVSEDGADSLVYTVTLNQTSASATSVNFTLSGSASGGVDYPAVTSPIIIAAGASAATVTIDPTTDTTIEPDETVTLTLSAGAGYTLGAPVAATGAILNDDVPSVSITVSPASVAEDGATGLTYTITRTAAQATPLTVGLVASGTATTGVDYTGGATTVTIPASSTTTTLTIDPSVDATVEASETVILTVAPGAGYTVGAPATATGTILDDDVPTASLTVSPSSVSEDGVASLVYTVTLDQPASSPTSVTFALGGTATSGADFAAISSPVVITPGATSATVTVDPVADTTVEPDETVTLTLSAGAGYALGAPVAATATLLNDDLPYLTVSDVTVSEGDSGTVIASFAVRLATPAGPGGVTFDIATTDDTARAGADYAARNLTAQILPAGATDYSFDVVVNGDLISEPSETFIVDVTSVSGAIVSDARGVGTIQNDDGSPTLSIGDVAVPEGDGGSRSAVFTVSLSAVSGQTVTVAYATADGTASSGSDYTAASGSLTFAPDVLSQTLTIAVQGDTAVEADETFTVLLSGPVNAVLADGAGEGAILNDDTAPALTGLSPASGPASGGTSVSITGSSLSGVTEVRFGSTPTAAFNILSDTTLTATTPPGTGEVDVTVVSLSGASAASAAVRFSYLGAPVASPLALLAPYNPGGAPATGLDLSAGVTGSVTSYTIGTASHGVVTLSGSQIQYTPDVGYAGPDSFTFTAVGPGGTSSPSTVTISVSAPVLSLSPGALTGVSRGQTYAATLVATGGVGPYAYAVTGGALPIGLILAPDGSLTGTPEASGSFSFTVTATDRSSGAGPFSVARAYTLIVDAPALALTPTGGPLPAATVDAAYDSGLSASGGIAPYRFAVTAGSLPTGLTLASDGRLTGTPRASGVFAFTITASDAATAGSGGPYTVSAGYSLSVGNAAPVAGDATLNVAYGAGPTAVSVDLFGGPTTSLAIASLPSLGSVAISGFGLTYTPRPDVWGEDSFTYTATGPGGASAPGVVRVVISAPVLSLNPATLNDAREDEPYAAVLTAEGGAAPYRFVVTAGALPAGLTLDPDGRLAGTPLAAGVYMFTITATDRSGGAGPASATQAYRLTVGAPPPPIVISPPDVIPVEGGSRGGAAVRIDLSALTSGDVTDIRIDAPPQNGAVVLERLTEPSGLRVIAVYTARAGYQGTDSFTFLAVGPGGPSAPATVRLNVVGLEPTAPSLSASTEQGQAVTVSLTDLATEGPFTEAAVVSVSPASAASVTLVPGGTAGDRTYGLTLRPRSDFAGIVVLTYTLSNTTGTSAPATVTLTVSARPSPSADPDVRALSSAQAQAARQFGVTQLSNFQRRNEQLHDAAGSRSAMGLSLASGRNGLFESPLETLPWAERERQLAEEREASIGASPAAAAAPGSAHLDIAAPEPPLSAAGPRGIGEPAVWSGGALAVGGFDATGQTARFDVTTSGVSAGADVRVNDRLIVGVGGGYGAQRTEIGESETGRLEGESWSGAVYGSYRPIPAVFVDGVLGYGALSFDTRRLAANRLTASGERNGSLVLVSLSAGWDRQRGASLISPYGRIDYVRTALDAYGETGAGLYSLAFEQRRLESVIGALGLRGQRTRLFQNGVLSQTGRLEWRHEFGGLEGERLDYADIGAFRYLIEGERWISDELAAELGLEIRYDSGLVLGLDLEGRASHGSRGATIRVRLARPF